MAFRNSGAAAKPKIFLPKDAIIPYTGTPASVTTLIDWTRYSEADDCYLYAAINNNQIGAITQEQFGTASFTATLGTNTHGTTAGIYQSITNATIRDDASTGHIRPADQTYTHTHTLGSATTLTGAGNSTMLNTQQVIFLKANKDTMYLPLNSLVFAQTQPTEPGKVVTGVYQDGPIVKNTNYLTVINSVNATVNKIPEIIPGMVVNGLPTTILPSSTKVISVVGNKVTLSSTFKSALGGLQSSLYSLTFTYTPTVMSNKYYASSSYYYLKGGSTVVSTTGKSYSISQNSTTSTVTGHNHADFTKRGYFLNPNAIGNVYSNYEFKDSDVAGAHNHSTTAKFSQTTINSKLLTLWKITRQAIPSNNIVVMYAGRIEDIPEPWYLCDGNNGTTNLGGYIIGYSGNTWDTATTANPSASLSINTFSSSHKHEYVIMRSSGKPTYGPKGYHSSFTWSHTHVLSNLTSTVTPYQPKTIGVAFIQYKG